jgi:hypothetical protein
MLMTNRVSTKNVADVCGCREYLVEGYYTYVYIRHAAGMSHLQAVYEKRFLVWGAFFKWHNLLDNLYVGSDPCLPQPWLFRVHTVSAFPQ